jgi:rod shape-determining protein MreD
MRLMAWQQREGGIARRLVPSITTLFFVLVSVVPLQIPGFAVVTPSFALMAVCHWSNYRPDLLPMSAVFALGLLLDLLNGTPYLGTSALTLLIARTAVLINRRHFVNRDFPVIWLGFLLLAGGTFAFTWAFVSLLNGHILGARPFLFQAVLTVACFPVGSYLLVRIHRAFLRS